MPQVLLLKIPCDSTSWTGTQVANHSWPFALAKSWTGSRKRNAPMSRVLRATPLMLSEQSNILTSTEKLTTSKADPPDRGPSHPGKATPCPVWHWPTIWNHFHSEDSCGFQWHVMDTVTPEFPLDLQNTSPEYFRYPVSILVTIWYRGWGARIKDNLMGWDGVVSLSKHEDEWIIRCIGYEIYIYIYIYIAAAYFQISQKRSFSAWVQ